MTEGWRSLISASCLLEQQRGALHPLEEARREHDVERGIGGAHGQRIAAEGRAVRAGGHALRRLGGTEERADRETAAERLGEPHDVGRDADALMANKCRCGPCRSAPRRTPGAGRARRRARAAP